MLIDLHQLYADRLMPVHASLINYADIAMIRSICTMIDNDRMKDGPTLVSAHGAGMLMSCKTAEDAEFVARDLAARVDEAEQQKMREHILLHTDANGEMLSRQLKAVHEP